jgi:DNA-binding NarL/FixJ family response regulator
MEPLTHSPIRILLADSVQRVRDAVRALIELQSDMQVVGEAGDGSTVRDLVESLHPDVTLLDVRLPDTSGLHLAADLHQACPEMALVLYTANPLSGTREAALRAGAASFVEKGASPQTLLEALRQAARGRTFPSAGALAPEGDRA